MKIIFLDIDGVLNSSPSKEVRAEWTSKYDYSIIQRKLYGFDSELVNNLKFILDKTEAKIVFSTSWRYFKDHHIEGSDWRKSLSELLSMSQDIFIGDTPDISTCGLWDLGYSRRRGLEIKSWIENNTEPGKYKYCVIDDEVSDIIGVIPEKNVVHINEKVGLTREDAEKAINILNG